MESTLSEIIRGIVEEVDPDKIILFGSRAKGENKECLSIEENSLRGFTVNFSV
jgi:predicted nucleotidyltransferase